jgi:hypothetical protein
MIAIATVLARFSWYWMLYGMRRPWIKRLQHRWLQPVPGQTYMRFPEGYIRQNRFARRFGLRLLVATYTLFVASVFITFAYEGANYMLESGMFQPPERAVAANTR